MVAPITRPIIFDWRAAPVYAIILIELLAVCCFVRYTGFRVASPIIIVPLIWSPYLIAVSLALRRFGREALATAFEAYALLITQGVIVMISTYPLTALSGPMADDWLAAADNALGFDARTFVPAMKHLTFWTFIYLSFEWQMIIVITFLIGNQSRIWTMVLAATVALAVNAAAYPFFPAVGVYAHHSIPNNGLDLPWKFVRVIHAIKEGDRTITPAALTGLTTFPSFHVAAGVIYAWAGWRTKARWPLVLLNLLLVPSTIIVGGHYLIDAVGGALLAAASISVSQPVISYFAHLPQARNRREEAAVS